MVPSKDFHVAIVGGGLCGISLAVALKVRDIPFTIYESRESFTEIGAGISLGPNGLQALKLIDKSLGDKIYKLATRNPPPNENTWMYCRYGAPSGSHLDGETIFELKAPPTGNMALHRQEFLDALATEMGVEHARFNRKLVSYEQAPGYVTLRFADGIQETASVLVGCDGIHSRVRAAMFGEDDIVSKPHFNGDGAYRAVIPMDKLVEALGDTARQGQMMLGPNGYVIYYPVNSGTAVNCGAWTTRKELSDPAMWVVPDQKQQFKHDMKDWGERVQKIIQFFDPNPAFWAAHQHVHQPNRFVDGRVILIGDGAHAMPPHRGAGASQAAEDAYVLSEVLKAVSEGDRAFNSVHAALRAVQDVRQPRFSKVKDFSEHGGPIWYKFYEQKLEGAELQAWSEEVMAHFKEIWDVDVAGEAEKAKQAMSELLNRFEQVNGRTA